MSVISRGLWHLQGEVEGIKFCLTDKAVTFASILSLVQTTHGRHISVLVLLWRGVYAAAVTLPATHVNLIGGGGLLKVAAARTPGAVAVNRPPLLTLMCDDGN